MELNLHICVNLTLNQKQSSIKFADGSLVPRKHTATYLGILFIDTVGNKKEVMNRIVNSVRTCNRLPFFGPKCETPFHQQLKFFTQSIGVRFYMG